MLNAAARAVLSEGRLAHLVTVNADGSPQVACVWVGLDGDDVVSAHLRPQAKLRNVRRDPRVALSVESGVRNAHGLDEYLVLHGRARVEEGGGAALLQELAQDYLGPDVVFPGRDAPPGWVLRITVERVGGIGPWSE